MMNDTAVGEVNLDPGDLSDIDAEDGEINDLEEGELRSDGDDYDAIDTFEKSEATNSQSSTYSKIISLKPDRPIFQSIRASDRLPSAGVCRFYLRDLCTWGERCKYFHPSEEEMSHYIEKNRYQRNTSTMISSPPAIRNNYSSHQPNGIVGKPVPLRSVNVGSVITSDSSSHGSSEIKKIHEDTKDHSCKMTDEKNDSSSSEKHSKKSGGSTLRSLFERTDLDFSNKKNIEKPKNSRHSRSASSSSSGSYRRNDRRGRDRFTHRHNNDNDRHHYNNRRRIDIEKFFKVNEEDAPAAYRNNSEKMNKRNSEKAHRVSSSSSSSSSLASNPGSRNSSNSRRRYKRRHRKSRESSTDSKIQAKHRRSAEEKRKPPPAVASSRQSHSPVIEPISSDGSEAEVKEDAVINQNSFPPKPTTSPAPNSSISTAKESSSGSSCGDGNNEDEEKKRKRLELLNQLKSVEEAIAKKRKKVNGIA